MMIPLLWKMCNCRSAPQRDCPSWRGSSEERVTVIMYLPAFPPWHALRTPRRLSSIGGRFLSCWLYRSWAACAHLPMTLRPTLKATRMPCACGPRRSHAGSYGCASIASKPWSSYCAVPGRCPAAPTHRKAHTFLSRPGIPIAARPAPLPSCSSGPLTGLVDSIREPDLGMIA